METQFDLTKAFINRKKSLKNVLYYLMWKNFRIEAKVAVEESL